MNPVMRNSEFRMQTPSRRAVIRRIVVSCVCILHSAFCIATARAQLQPGTPGSMGFSSGIVASNVPPQFKDVTFKQQLGTKLPLDVRFKDEAGQSVALGDYFGKKPVVLAFV